MGSFYDFKLKIFSDYKSGKYQNLSGRSGCGVKTYFKILEDEERYAFLDGFQIGYDLARQVAEQSLIEKHVDGSL